MVVLRVAIGVVLTLCLNGCVSTPIEIKTASRKQLELIDSLDQAAADLQAALDRFHSDNETLITQEGRMLIARQAIDLAVSSAGGDTVTADQLLQIYKTEIEPWIDNAFRSSSLEARVTQLQERISATTDPIARNGLEMKLDDLRLDLARLGNKPPPVVALEAVIKKDLNDETKTAERNRLMLEILRSQIALIKTMQTRVDTWLSIDVTLTQDQIDSLKSAYTTALGDLGEDTQ